MSTKEAVKRAYAHETGFTMIELIMVIVILGVLAAMALPRFVDLGGSARLSTLNSLAGSIRSAYMLAHAQQLATGGSNGTAITVDGTTINMQFGYPTAASIGSMLADISGFNQTSSGVFQMSSAPTPGSCQVAYTAAPNATSVPGVVTTNTGCQ